MANEFARRLRKDMTDTEQFVWKRVRYRQIGGYKFRRQAPVGPFIADFVCHEAKVILELDGDQHAEQADQDAARSGWFESQGYVVARFWNHEAFQDWDAIEDNLWRLLNERAPRPPNSTDG
jgi:very-short-patch-repair endonuclease